MRRSSTLWWPLLPSKLLLKQSDSLASVLGRPSGLEASLSTLVALLLLLLEVLLLLLDILGC